MSSNNESARETTKMNQTMLTSFELKKPAGLQAGRSCDFRSTHFLSNIQNVSQNIQRNFQQAVQPKNGGDGGDLQERNPTNPKATSSMISSEIFTHYKKQKIQNLMNESSTSTGPQLAGDQPLPSTNSSKADFLSGGLSLAAVSDSKPGGGGANFNILNQTASQLSNQLSNQLIGPFGNAQSIGYPESSLSSPGSTGSSDSNDQAPVEHDLPVDLKIKNVAHLNANGNNPDTSCSSNEFKDDNHQDYFANSELLNKINLASQMSMFQRTNHDLQSILDKIELKIIKEPAKYHRARYMTEGSRGPIRDKSGKSFPTIKLIGYNKRPCQAICFLTDDKHRNTPHLFYQASKLTSRCLTNCTEVKLPNSNTNALQFELHPRNDMELMIDCLGIVKQRLFEIQQQNSNSNPEKSAFKTPLCRLAFEVYIEEYNHVVKTYSDTIHCKQMMRAPEIHRMSIKECHISGDKELFIIGKNFSKDIKLYFKYENHLEECVTPVKELFHQAHLVCNVPKIDPQVMNRLGRPFTDKFGETSKRLTVELYAICDNKQSGKEQFTYYS